MDLIALKAELDVDPLSRGYAAMSDADVAADLNVLYRDGPTDPASMFSFLLLENTHKTDGSDTQDRSLWLRIKEVNDIGPWSAAQANPWGSTTIGNITEIQGVKCTQLWEFLNLVITGNVLIVLTDTNFKVYLAGAQAAGCMSTAQETELIALSENQISRGVELGFGFVGHSDVEDARAL